jgi:hypothetical protein
LSHSASSSSLPTSAWYQYCLLTLEKWFQSCWLYFLYLYKLINQLDDSKDSVWFSSDSKIQIVIFVWFYFFTLCILKTIKLDFILSHCLAANLPNIGSQCKYFGDLGGVGCSVVLGNINLP